MSTLRPLVAALLGSMALGTGCYSEQLPPSNYRYACDSDADCTSEEVCRRGRCERPCTQLGVLSAAIVAAEVQPCPFDSGYAGCYNGACANTCALDSDFCSPGQTCVDVGLDPSSGGFGGGSSAEVGVCVLECDDGDNADLCLPSEVCDDGVCTAIDCENGEPCPADHTCFFGMCSATCSANTPCPAGYSCLAPFGICTPDCDPECTEGFTCFFGACAVDCSEDPEVCPEGQSCTLDVCIIDEFELPGSGSGTGSSTTTTDGGGGSTGNGGGSTDGGGSTGAGGSTTGDGIGSTGDSGSSTGMAVAPASADPADPGLTNLGGLR